MNILIPDAAAQILDMLERAGYSAYIVGGAVRDALMGRIANDFDVATSATPDETKRVFSDYKTVDTGIRHGTVTVLVDSSPYEVTTYRIDGEYADLRHPDGVSFTDRIEEDLARRDFTVNAIAYSPSRGITDPYAGIADIESRLIRAVGEPSVRFGEDALRILRALRFSSQLGFSIEENTALALRSSARLLSGVSRERVLVEWRKLLAGKRAHAVLAEFFDIISYIIPELDGVTLPAAEAFAVLDSCERMFALYATLGSDTFVRSMRSLRSDNSVVRRGVEVLSTLSSLESFDRDALLKCYISFDSANCRSAINIARALSSCDADAIAYLTEVLSSGRPSSLPELAVGGEEMLALGISGQRIGKILESLLMSVANGEAKNDKSELIALAQKRLSFI